MIKKAAIIIIGNEILSGDIRDDNIYYLIKELANIAIYTKQVRIIADDAQEIINNINELRTKYDYVFTTGGIGPTHDDITTESIAKALGRSLILDPKTEQDIKDYYKKSSQDRIEAAMKMAYFPQGAKFIYNPVSNIPGFYIENIYVMAGVPAIMRAMFDDIKSKLTPGDVIKTRSILFNSGESIIAKDLSLLQKKYPNIDIGSYPFIDREQQKWCSNLVLKSSNDSDLDNAYSELELLVKKLIP